jgi:hypothetical protein
MKRIVLIFSSIFIFFYSGLSQIKENSDNKILFRGLIMDATDFSPVSNAQIMINNAFSTVSGVDGSFLFYVNRNDTVTFRSLGYKESEMHISDTLRGAEFIAGIYLNTDTLAIGEVVIVPSYTNLRSEILNSKSKAPATMDNARYNVAVSAYQGKNSQNILGDPQDNYALLNQRQKIDAFEKGGIGSEHIVGFNPLIFLPAAYLLIHGLPENAAPMKPQITQKEIDQIQKKYFETLKQRK